MGRFVDKFLLKCGLCKDRHLPLTIEGHYQGGKRLMLLECPKCGYVWKAESISGEELARRRRRNNENRHKGRIIHGRLTGRLREYAGTHRI